MPWTFPVGEADAAAKRLLAAGEEALYAGIKAMRPRGVLAEFGLALGEEVEIRVWDSTAEIRYLVLPDRPAGTEGLSEEALADLVSRDAMVGISKAASPGEVRR